jgi:hypothetical protein
MAFSFTGISIGLTFTAYRLKNFHAKAGFNGVRANGF